MTRASTLPALLLAPMLITLTLIAPTLVAGCGSSSGAPSAEAVPGRPVRLADHETSPDPGVEAESGEARTVVVTAPAEDGPHADPPPVEPPAFED